MTHSRLEQSRPESVQNPPSSRTAFIKSTRLSWIIFPAILLIYLLFPTKNYYWDGISFARVIEAAEGLNSSLLHPNHLLYSVIGFVLYKAMHALGFNWRALEVLQVANSVVSVLTAFLLFLSLRRTVRSSYLVWALALLFAFSATWWKFSTDAGAYIFSVFSLILAFYLTLDHIKARPLVIALIFSIAVFLHQLAVLAYPAIALAVYHTAGSQRERSLNVLKFCLAAFLLVITTYYYCFFVLTGTPSIAGFLKWITSYSPDASFSFGFLSNLGYSLRGNLRLFFNLRLSLLRGLLSPAIIVTIAIFLLVLLLWLFVVVRRTNWHDLISRVGSRSTTFAGPRVKVYLVWIGVYVLFLFVWLPQNTFYRLFYLPALILLGGEWLARGGLDLKTPTFRLGLFVVLMALSNFLFFIYPNTRIEKYAPLFLALEMNQVWRPGDIVYFHSQNSDKNLMSYFNPAVEWRPLPELDQMDFEMRRTYHEGNTAWLDASAIDKIRAHPRGEEWLGSHGRLETWRERKARGYNVKFVQVGP